jgi:hypothetical protein
MSEPKKYDTIYRKRFAWLPTQIRQPDGPIVIWLRRYYEKRIFVENDWLKGWAVYRSLKPFPSEKGSHLKVIK